MQLENKTKGKRQTLPTKKKSVSTTAQHISTRVSQRNKNKDKLSPKLDYER